MKKYTNIWRPVIEIIKIQSSDISNAVVHLFTIVFACFLILESCFSQKKKKERKGNFGIL